MTTDRIRNLNDAFRTKLTGGRIMLTRGIVGREDANDILKKVQTFEAFDEGCDPFKERDFGSLEGADGVKICFKIDYYNLDLTAGSPDPSDPSITVRVLTVMLASEI
ncbi:MAG: hypothetical protein JWR21_828 [Herminiimonas sp.]|nr:hypothetical protein [Herminiimonas sp.]